MRTILLATSVLWLIGVAAYPALAFETVNGTAAIPEASRGPVPKADPFDTQAMLVGDKVLAVADSRQLTLRADGDVVETYLSPDGKYVVYLIADNRGEAEVYDCRLAKVSTGKTITVMSRLSTQERQAVQKEAWSMDDSPQIAWSPDSSLFALKATQWVTDAGKRTQQQFIVVYAASGAFRKALPVDSPTDGEDRCTVSQRLLFTPDSRQILATVLIPDMSISERFRPMQPVLRLYDIGTGGSRDLSSPPLTPVNPKDTFVVWSQMPFPVGWSSDGSLLLMTFGDGQAKLRRVSVSGNSVEALANTSAAEVWSSDGAFAIVRDRGVSIRAQQAETATPLIASADVDFMSWSPNNRMILYTKSESMNDVTKPRKRDFHSLWLSTIDPAKPRSLCVALDAEGVPSASRDCHQIAYIRQGQLHVAELALREPSVSEKLASGIPLTEEETKATLATNAKQIALGIIMYCADNGGKMPPAGAVKSSLTDYLSTRDLFLKPGSNEDIFRYVDPGVGNQSDIKNPADTVLGELDAGYGWKARLYADGHVEIQSKQ